MNFLMKSLKALSLMALIQSAAGQELTPEAPLMLSDLATVSKVDAPTSPSLQLKNVISGDTTSTVGQITLSFNSDGVCGTAINQKVTSGGTPLPFPENTTISISPSSVYTAAITVGIDVTTINSVAVTMVDNSLNFAGVFKGISGSTPCFIVTCYIASQQCSNGSSVSFITQKV